jgi:SAM-dependent methyltransferase
MRLGDDGHTIIGCDGRTVFCHEVDGCFDFVIDEHSHDEREHYDRTYEAWADASQPVDEADFMTLWKTEPWDADLLESIGDVRGKRILLIGNGTSLKEFLFVARGAQCTYTDLSFTAVRKARTAYLSSRLRAANEGGCEFHAVNACFLPYDDHTFDIVYGNAFVHHMDDLNAFFAEIFRCLKPGGICRFSDTAYSSIWQGSKSSILHPLQTYIHRTRGISPQDVRATKRGGYTSMELEQLKRNVGFHGMYFKRVSIFDYLAWRGAIKLGARWLYKLRPLMRQLDQLLRARTSLMERQGIVLVFGFDK